MKARIEGAKSIFAFIRNIPQIELLCVFRKPQTRACICTSTWVVLSDTCVTAVNRGNVFYCKISEYIHCPQQVGYSYV
jgi:hypothetical protein